VSFVATPIRLIWRHRRILRAVVASELRGRYAGSVLGTLWLGIYPALFLATYAIVYLFIFKVRPFNIGLNRIEYIALLFCGLIPFITVAECLSVGTSCVSSSPQLMKNTLFPIALLPVKAVLCAQVMQLVGVVLLTAVLLVLHGIGLTTHTVGIYYPWLFVVWFFQIVFSIGLIWVLSAVNVFVRDLGQSIGLVNLLLMMVSPIAWTEGMLRNAFQEAPRLLFLMRLNPLYHMIMSYQRAEVLGQPPSPVLLGTFAAGAVVLFFGGYKVFSALQQVFVENV
jgi:lipopolysaccharide transport system permease protein